MHIDQICDICLRMSITGCVVHGQGGVTLKDTRPKRILNRKISFAHNLLLSCITVLKFCTEHGSITAVLCANFQNDLTTEVNAMNEISRDFSFFF